MDSSIYECVTSKHGFWKVINSHVTNKDPLRPAYTFRHASQVFYSRTKCGVDSVSQFRTILRAVTTCLPWEHNYALHSVKNILINSFISYQILSAFFDGPVSIPQTLPAIRSSLNCLAFSLFCKQDVRRAAYLFGQYRARSNEPCKCPWRTISRRLETTVSSGNSTKEKERPCIIFQLPQRQKTSIVRAWPHF